MSADETSRDMLSRALSAVADSRRRAESPMSQDILPLLPTGAGTAPEDCDQQETTEQVNP